MMTPMGGFSAKTERWVMECLGKAVRLEDVGGNETYEVRPKGGS
jgi:hypothetical protein